MSGSLFSTIILDASTGQLLYQYTPLQYSIILPSFANVGNLSSFMQSFVQLGREFHKTIGLSSSSVVPSVSPSSIPTTFPSINNHYINIKGRSGLIHRVRFYYEKFLSLEQYNQLLTLLNYTNPPSSTTTSTSTTIVLPNTNPITNINNNNYSSIIYSDKSFPLSIEALYMFPYVEQESSLFISNYYCIGFILLVDDPNVVHKLNTSSSIISINKNQVLSHDKIRQQLEHILQVYHNYIHNKNTTDYTKEDIDKLMENIFFSSESTKATERQY